MPKLLDAIGKRFACRHFDADAPPGEAELALLCEAGRLAPSAFGLEPWRFIIVTDATERAAIAQACFDQPAAATAPAFIAVVALVDDLAPDSGYVRRQFEAEARGGDTAPIYEAYRALYRSVDIAAWAVGQCSFAAAHILLEAAHLGLGSCPIGGYDAAALCAALKLEEGEIPALVIALGHCAEPQPARVRKILG